MRMPYQYVILRCVPHVVREEFFNVGVALYCQEADFLSFNWRVNTIKAKALDAEIDLIALTDTLMFLEAVCDADPEAGAVAAEPIGTRFGFVKAPRSTVVQVSPVHGGTTENPADELYRLIETLVD